MHELSVTENILEIALRNGNQANAKKITDLYLVIGQLSSIVDDSIQFYWDLIAKGTPAEGARLHFKRIKTQLKCRVCENEFVYEGREFKCSKCGCESVDIISGDEFYFEAIDVEN
jgi:hydrogenase nickel incorporation protein HypA/HybF